MKWSFVTNYKTAYMKMLLSLSQSQATYNAYTNCNQIFFKRFRGLQRVEGGGHNLKQGTCGWKRLFSAEVCVSSSAYVVA